VQKSSAPGLVVQEIVKVTREDESNLKRLTQAEILDLNADEVIEMIRQAKSYVQIQEKFGVHEKYVAEFITSSEHSPRAREAQRQSAETIAEKAENSLLQIQADDTQASVTRQRELASHYRWLAAKKNPAKFGDSTKISAEIKDTSSTRAWLEETLATIDKNK
jgi:3-methyladenine DNA glycosylase Tag